MDICFAHILIVELILNCALLILIIFVKTSRITGLNMFSFLKGHAQLLMTVPHTGTVERLLTNTSIIQIPLLLQTVHLVPERLKSV